MKVREDVSKALEIARRDKVIGSPLEAKVVLYPTDDNRGLLDRYLQDLKFIFIVSSVEIGNSEKPERNESSDTIILNSEEMPGFSVLVDRAEGNKCERCWNYSLKVGEYVSHPTICERCVTVVA